MEWLWIIQLVINVIVVFSLFVWWKDRGHVSADGTGKLQVVLQCESQALQLERDIAMYRKKSEEQLRFLIQLCEQAHAILMRHTQTSGNGLSLEEEELKGLRHTAPVTTTDRNIPSVQELETKKKALRPQIPLDLRSLLRDQLT